MIAPRPTRCLPLISLALLLAGCPEERPGAERQIPAQRVPPAMSVEPAAGDGGALGAPAVPGDAGAPRR